MQVTLDPTLDALVRRRVERGDYDSADALVQEAIQRLIEDDIVEDSELDQIRRRVQAGEDQIVRGEFVEYDASNVQRLAREVHERRLKRIG